MRAKEPSTDYFSIRYRHDADRSLVWREIIRDLSDYFPANPAALELGPGYCDFINQLPAASKFAIDINPTARQYTSSDVTFIQGDCCDLPAIEDGSLDLVFASNLLEHLDRQQAVRLLRSTVKALKPEGRLILIQPNFRYSYREYYDDYTHITPYTDGGLCGLLESEGYRVVKSVARYLPLSMNTGSWIPRYGWLVRMYLNLPFRPFAKQMLIVAEKPIHQGA